MTEERNGYYARNTETVKPQAGAQELQRIVDALRAGNTPNPADVDALRALRPTSTQSQLNIDISTLIADLHSGDPDKRERAWESIAPILPDDVSKLKLGVELIEDWSAIELSDRKWLIPGWLPAGRIGMFSGKGGKGKTWLMMQLAAAMASGDCEWLGRTTDLTKQGPLTIEEGGIVIFASWEDEGMEFKRRLLIMKTDERRNAGAVPLFERMKNPEAMDKSRFVFLDVSRRGPAWGVKEGDLYNARPGLLPAGELIREQCEKRKAKLLILDSLGYAYGRNDSDNEGVADFMAAWDSWGRDNNCSVLLIHHPPKPQANGATNSGYRGASSWEMHARFRWELGDGAGGEDMAKLSCEKASYAMRPDPVYLERSQKTGWAWRAANDQTPKLPVNADGQCQGMTRNRERCKGKATTNGYCGQHQAQAIDSSNGRRGEEIDTSDL